MVETVVTLAVITVMTSAAIVFFLERQELAQRHVVAGRIVDAIHRAAQLPSGQALSFRGTAQTFIAEALEAEPPSVLPDHTMRVDTLQDGFSIGPTSYVGRPIAKTRDGSYLDLSSNCKVGDLQVAFDLEQFPPDGELGEEHRVWFEGFLREALPDAILDTGNGGGIFLCLPS